MAYTLKPFQLNSTDLEFILRQVNFLPLFDALGNASGKATCFDSGSAAFSHDGNLGMCQGS